MRTQTLLLCDHCHRTHWMREAEVRYRMEHGSRAIYCGKKCSGLARRRSSADKKARKAAYDREYRAKNMERIKTNKAAYYRATFDPEKMRADRERKKAAGYDHAAYCREYYSDPKRKAHKQKYDQERRDHLRYGEYAEAAAMLRALKREVNRLVPDQYERLKLRGYFDRGAQQRRRDAGIQRANR